MFSSSTHTKNQAFARTVPVNAGDPNLPLHTCVRTVGFSKKHPSELTITYVQIYPVISNHGPVKDPLTRRAKIASVADPSGADARTAVRGQVYGAPHVISHFVAAVAVQVKS
jgi:hypothetical protein